MKKSRFRAPLKTAKGHGSAKTGTGHWINQRITAIALIPLTFFFMVTLIKLITAEKYYEIESILSNPFWLSIMVLFILVGFYHGTLGVQVILEDYISSELPKMLLLICVRLLAGFLAALGVLSILYISLI